MGAETDQRHGAVDFAKESKDAPADLKFLTKDVDFDPRGCHHEDMERTFLNIGSSMVRACSRVGDPRSL